MLFVQRGALIRATALRRHSAHAHRLLTSPSHGMPAVWCPIRLASSSSGDNTGDGQNQRKPPSETLQHDLHKNHGAEQTTVTPTSSSSTSPGAESGEDANGLLGRLPPHARTAWGNVSPEQHAQARERGEQRLRQLFSDNLTQQQWRQRSGAAFQDDAVGGSASSFSEHGSSTTIVEEDGDEGEGGNEHITDEPRAGEEASLRRGSVPPSSRGARTLLAMDEDDAGTQWGQGNEHTISAGPLSVVETLEQELLDDAYAYFPPDVSSASTTAGAVSHFTATQSEPHATPYIPGQQIIPPGLTRYRVDVQYQGSDFDGWYKSTARQTFRREVGPDGSVRRVPVSASAHGVPAGGVLDDPMASRHFAKTVLEEALAVAVDVPTTTVVAAAIPETGVSVHRLVCHVDLPSDVEMQPRTIIQRATMWLQKRQQPLAILACHPCRNQDFHARHSATRRVYCYRILNRVAPPLFDAGLQWHVDRHLDAARMQRFAKAMEGTKDFGYFADPKMANALRRAATSTPGRVNGAYSDEHYQPTALGLAPGKHPAAPKETFEKGLSNLQRAAALPTFNEYGQRVLSYNAKPREYFKASTNLPTIRTVDRIDVVRQDDEVLIWFVGQSFLRHQIRNMVSVLKASGHGLWDELELQHAFSSGFEVSRKRFTRERLPPAPAHGLTLWDVEYPKQHRDDFVAFVDSGPYEEVVISPMD